MSDIDYMMWGLFIGLSIAMPYVMAWLIFVILPSVCILLSLAMYLMEDAP